MGLRHPELIGKMTDFEKAAFLSGKDTWQSRDIARLGIPSITCSDGPHGLRRQAGAGDHLGLNASLPATCFPTAAGIANSWDEALGEKIGQALGEEAVAQGVNVLLGPGLNIKRSPLCGRNFEYFSEDPYLAGKMAAAYVRGIQSRGVYSCIKHFAVNSRELRRMAMNAVIDERTLRELYLTGFEIALKEGNARAVMSAYNEVNGIYANENQHLLIDILRKEWGFDGIVITDWGASNDHTAGVKARSNLEMPAPGLDSARELLESLENGKLTREELDVCVDDLLDAVLTLKGNIEIEGSGEPEKAENLERPGEAEKPKVQKMTEAGFDVEEHHKLAGEAALESAVLLKNENHILPIGPKTKVALIGDFAFEPRFQGGGSSSVNPTKSESIEQCQYDCGLEIVGRARGYRRDGKADQELLEGALSVAKHADVTVLFFGLDEISESEGLDRTHLEIRQNQVELIEALAKVNPHQVGVISAGSVIEMPWADHFEAILHGYLNGQAGAGALLKLLSGEACPSGKLAETYPETLEDTPSLSYYSRDGRNSEYRESLFVGYRYYDTARMKVRYPFGYGLSYTTFAYTDLKIHSDGVTFRLSNTGEREGTEIAQMYVGCPDSMIFRPEKELKGFARVTLKPGESRTVSIPFDDKTFRCWDTKNQRWAVEYTDYEIWIGASSADIRLKGKLECSQLLGKKPAEEKEKSACFAAYPPLEKQDAQDRQSLPSYFTGKVTNVSNEEYARLLGTPVPDGSWSGTLQANDAFCQMYYAKNGLARLVYRILDRLQVRSLQKGKPDLNILFIYNMPFRALAKMTGGAVDRVMVSGIVTMVNGHFFRGLGQVIKGFFANRKANREGLEQLEKPENLQNTGGAVG